MIMVKESKLCSACGYWMIEKSAGSGITNAAGTSWQYSWWCSCGHGEEGGWRTTEPKWEVERNVLKRKWLLANEGRLRSVLRRFFRPWLRS